LDDWGILTILPLVRSSTPVTMTDDEDVDHVNNDQSYSMQRILHDHYGRGQRVFVPNRGELGPETIEVKNGKQERVYCFQISPAWTVNRYTASRGGVGV
jgi:hypothetical protein